MAMPSEKFDKRIHKARRKIDRLRALGRIADWAMCGGGENASRTPLEWNSATRRNWKEGYKAAVEYIKIILIHHRIAEGNGP